MQYTYFYRVCSFTDDAAGMLFFKWLFVVKSGNISIDNLSLCY